MKRFAILLSIAFLLTALPSCHPDCHGDLVIFTGIDQRECACCGGFMIDFSNNPEPYAGEFKLAYELPVNSGIEWDSEFPIYAWIQWEPVESPCDVIEVYRVRKID